MMKKCFNASISLSDSWVKELLGVTSPSVIYRIKPNHQCVAATNGYKQLLISDILLIC